MFERANLRPHRIVFSLLVCALLGLGCKQIERRRIEAKLAEYGPVALRHYADIAYAAYGETLGGARALQVALMELTADPSAERLESAQSAWLEARVSYAQTEVFRFYDGPIDEVEMFVNAWPIDENYLESADAQQRGIINDLERYPQITCDVLTTSNEKGSETNISTGYHALEFLLWGRDTNVRGPGARAFRDFVDDPRNPEPGRRGMYLLVASELLIGHLERVHEAWSPERRGNYREKFLALPAPDALGLVIKGMGTLSGPELAGERLTVAYETKDQENEHSCFSDSTRNDVVHNAFGIENVCRGNFRTRDGAWLQGPGICALLSEFEPALGEELTEQIRDSARAAREIPAPFDQAILGDDAAAGRRGVLRAIRALEAQTATLATAAAALGIGLTIPTDVPQ